VPPEPPRADLADYRGLVVPAPLLPFRASGSVLFHHGDEVESGTMVLGGTAGGAYRLEVHARLTGALALELRFDERRLLFLDHASETYFLGPNGPEERRRLFSLDVTPAEFQFIVTGRVPRPWFEGGAGRLDGAGGAAFARDGARYRIDLDDHGLPRRWVKERDGATVFEVQYRSYSEVTLAEGAPLRLPRTVRVGLPGRPPLLVLGIREFLPARAPLLPVNLAAPEGERWRPAPLP